MKEVTGPPKSVSYDAAGKPTRAAESFAQKMNVPVDKLVTISTPKGEYLSAKQVILGRSAKEILEEILPRAVAEIPWPRSMYWTGAAGLHFIRPIRWVVALLGGKPLQCQLGRCRGREFFVGPPLSRQSKDSSARRQGLRPKIEGQLCAGPARGPQEED